MEDQYTIAPCIDVGGGGGVSLWHWFDTLVVIVNNQSYIFCLM